jgi:hypothetical protein
MFTSWCYRVALARQLLLLWVLFSFGTVLQLCTCSVLQFCYLDFSLVPVCGSFFFRLLDQMRTVWCSAILFVSLCCKM